MSEQPFWERKSLAAMSRAEWEALCDGCGRCCLHKFVDDTSGALLFTDVACARLDPERCRCTVYAERTRHVSSCLQLSPDRPERFDWLPESCAYRRLHEGRSLPAWHPLRTGDPSSTARAGVSVGGWAVCGADIGESELLDHVIAAFPGEEAL